MQRAAWISLRSKLIGWLVTGAVVKRACTQVEMERGAKWTCMYGRREVLSQMVGQGEYVGAVLVVAES